MQGPTLTMKIHKYSLMKDVTATQNKPSIPDTLWQVSVCKRASSLLTMLARLCPRLMQVPRYMLLTMVCSRVWV